MGALLKIAHRGAPRQFQGNTMSGFRRGVALGCGMVECDVRQAADGELVLAHDPWVTDAAGAVYEITATPSALLRALDLGRGEGVPGLGELVGWAAGRCAVMADMKCGGGDVEERLVHALAPLVPREKVVPGAGEASRRRMRALDPALPLSLTLDAACEPQIAAIGVEHLIARLDTQAVTWQHPLITAERVALLHAADLRVYVWTVDEPPLMRKLMADGVDGIISNRPDLLAAL